MKKLLVVLVLILTLQIPSQADDIRDFHIEGMSVGDSLLDYFNKEEINESRVKAYKDDTFLPVEFSKSSFEVYDILQIAFKKNDRKYIIHSISGIVQYEKDIENCENQKKAIEYELSELFKNADITDEGKRKHPMDKKSVATSVIFDLGEKDGIFADNVTVSCIDFSEESNLYDHLRVGIKTLEYDKWLAIKAYK